MVRKTSRLAGAMAAIAGCSMIATPALARGGNWGSGWGGGWGKRYHHRDRIDTGDVLAGILVPGGIVAVASAASKPGREARERDYPRRDRRDDPRYGEPRDRGQPSSRGIGMAVDACADEVERADRTIETITGVERDGAGWRVEGRVSNGRAFACSVADGGRIRSVTVDGRAAWSDDERARDAFEG